MAEGDTFNIGYEAGVKLIARDYDTFEELARCEVKKHPTTCLIEEPKIVNE